MRPHRFADHPSRPAVLAEVHARPVELVPAPARLRRVALLLPRQPDAVANSHQHFAQWCRGAGIAAPAGEARQFVFDRDNRRVTWELHTEFVTLTWMTDLSDYENWPLGIGLEAFDTETMIAAMRIDLIESAVLPDRIIAGFQLPSLCASSIEDGQAQLATDLVTDADGFTRFEMAAGGLTALKRGIAVRRLLEIETYRTMALLGLPLAREVSPRLNALEAELELLVEEMAGAASTEAAQHSLAALHSLSVRAGQLVERTSYRFAASHAYGSILNRRLSRLGERSLGPGSTLERYLGNRIEPALSTCQAVEKRQRSLAEKIERATELLNTRIGLDIQTQNKAVLSSISETAQSQFRLQRTVEGLSVIAIAYYLIGILSYLLTGVSEVASFPKPLVIALAVPVVIVGVWMFLRRVQRSH